MRAMRRTFRNRGGLPWWYWRALANRIARRGASTPLDEQLIAMITGEGSYYRVSDLDTLFVERTGASATTPAEVDGLVGTVLDKGPNGRHLTSQADANRPTLRFVDGVYYLESVNTLVPLMYVDGFPNADIPPHYFAAAVKKPTGGTAVSAMIRRATSSNYATLRGTASDQLQATRRLAAGVSSATIASQALGAWSHVDSLFLATSENVAINGGAFTTTSHASDETAMQGNLIINGDTTGGGLAPIHWAGGLYLNREPTTAERTTINTTMNAMYDATVLDDLGLLLE